MKVHIAIPAYQRKVDVGVLTSICSLISHYSQWSISLDHVDASITSQGRNVLVKRFLETDSGWLLFWDNDIVVHNPDFLSRMVSTASTLEAAIVSAPCRLKGKDALNCGQVINSAVLNHTEITHPRLVDVAGSGLMLIHRSVFEKVSEPWFEVIDHAGGEALGEDFNFCLKAREQGFEIAVEPRITTTHYGVAGWTHQEVRSQAV